ncbi:MAG: restriction endonuclease [Deltaproteobacteria bacterium]|nr:restriction endonuclease [Deltaproteobacteria bacterium]
MTATRTAAAPTGRNKPAQGKERSDVALGHASQKTSSPGGAIEGGELPKGWRRVAIKDMADSIQYGHTASAVERKDGPRFLRITDIQEGRVDWSTVPSCNIPQDDISKYRLSAGDLVFARTGATTGKSFLIGDCPEAVFASYLIRVRVSSGVDSRYLSAFFQSPDYWRQIEGGKRGIGQPNVNGTVLGEVQFPLAPFPEQRRIVAEIEKQFTRLEAGVAALRRVQANLKRYRAAVLKAACEGRLVPTEAELACLKPETRNLKPEFETGAALLARILTERRQNWQGRGKYKEPAAPDTTCLATLPEGWTWASPEQLSAAESYSFAIGPFGSNLKVSDYTDSGVPLVFVRNIRASRFGGDGTVFVSKTKAEELRAHSVSGGDVLITKMGAPPGDACLYPDSEPDAMITADCIKLRLSPLLPQRRFFVHTMNSEVVKPQLQLITKGVAQMKVSLGRFSTLAIPLPPLAEQTRIVAEVERRLSVVEELEAVVSANLQRATRLRQSILQKAFAGQL